MEIVLKQTPEEQELRAKQAALAALEGELAGRELDLATLRARLNAFEKQYTSVVGKCYAELDEVLAELAEAEARLNPNDPATAQKAAEGRQQARESARAADAVNDTGPLPFFEPSETLKKLYRRAAKTLHPDLGDSNDDRTRRHGFMTRANQAYEDGDEDALRAVLRDWESSPESVSGEGVGADLVRTIRKISRVQERLRVIDAEIASLGSSNMFKLHAKTVTCESSGRDLLSEMASRLAGETAAARARLHQLLRSVVR